MKLDFQSIQFSIMKLSKKMSIRKRKEKLKSTELSRRTRDLDH